MRSGPDAELRRDVAVAVAPLARVVPVVVAVADQLREILVAGDEHRRGGRRPAAASRCVPMMSSASCVGLLNSATPSSRHNSRQSANWRFSSGGAGSRLAL